MFRRTTIINKKLKQHVESSVKIEGIQRKQLFSLENTWFPVETHVITWKHMIPSGNTCSHLKTQDPQWKQLFSLENTRCPVETTVFTWKHKMSSGNNCSHLKTQDVQWKQLFSLENTRNPAKAYVTDTYWFQQEWPTNQLLPLPAIGRSWMTFVVCIRRKDRASLQSLFIYPAT
jgi:hypothetical protein